MTFAGDVTKKLRKALDAREQLKDIMRNCSLCPSNCGVDRLKGKKGMCGCGNNPVVYTSLAHMGEEPPLSGNSGSGAIFFSGCGMKCVYCQNHIFSQSIEGRTMDGRGLGQLMLDLQYKGCHNINLVNPLFYLPSVIEGIIYALQRGLNLPVIYNTGGYESLNILKKLAGIVDIYLPDMRYSSSRSAEKYSGVKNYTEINRSAVLEMHRQVGDLKVASGLAVSGLIVRMLVLPSGISGTAESLKFLTRHIGPTLYISVMSQYYPAYMACEFSELNTKIDIHEYSKITDLVRDLKFENGWVQPFGGSFKKDLFGENLKALCRPEKFNA